MLLHHLLILGPCQYEAYVPVSHFTHIHIFFRPRNSEKKELKGISGRERVPFGANINAYIERPALTMRGKENCSIFWSQQARYIEPMLGIINVGPVLQTVRQQ